MEIKIHFRYELTKLEMVVVDMMEDPADQTRFNQTQEEWDNLADITAEFQGTFI
jgi:hypothetical protein